MSEKFVWGALGLLVAAGLIGYYTRLLVERMDKDPGPTNWVGGIFLAICVGLSIFLISPALSFMVADEMYRWRWFPFTYITEILLTLLWLVIFLFTFYFNPPWRKKEEFEEEKTQNA